MRLLFDQNLSLRLATDLRDIYPNSSHVALVGLDQASDEAVWQYAKAYDFTIVTKDADYSEISVLRGFPPRVIWLRLANCTTTDVEHTLRRGYDIIRAFSGDPAAGVLALS